MEKGGNEWCRVLQVIIWAEFIMEEPTTDDDTIKMQ